MKKNNHMLSGKAPSELWYEYNQKILQKILGNLLYNTISIDPTMLMALNSSEEMQKKLITVTTIKITQFLNYSATHPYEITEYVKGAIIIHIYSNASYISVDLESRNRAGGYFLLGTKYKTPIRDMPLENGPVHA